MKTNFMQKTPEMSLRECTGRDEGKGISSKTRQTKRSGGRKISEHSKHRKSIRAGELKGRSRNSRCPRTSHRTVTHNEAVPWGLPDLQMFCHPVT